MTKKISARTQMEIAFQTNAMVATYFAMFQNPTNVGSAFTWEKFIEMMVERSRSWLNIHTQFNKQEHYALAEKFSKKEAERLVKLMQE